MHKMKKVLVTGSAGFIGSFLTKVLAENGYDVVGIDNINHYYDVNLKYGRLREICGIEKEEISENKSCKSHVFDNLKFIKADINDREFLNRLFDTEKFDIVCNLAAQAGVRYSIENPFSYADSNLMGFLTILECCRNYKVGHLVYASSSSVYGMNDKTPFSEDDKTDSPVSLYAATKKANELMANAYSSLYKFSTTGLRFFTVYGPWGRPDMAPFIFMKAILNGKPIHIFNNGNMRRDFTYISDIINGVLDVIKKEPENVRSEVYNIGHGAPVELMDFIKCMEKVLNVKGAYIYEGMKAGDVTCTYADTTKLEKDYGYYPKTSVEDGLDEMYIWFKNNVNKFD